MLGRALSLATVTLLTGWFVMGPVWAQTQNLEAGKSPSQIFAGTCNACHKSPRGLLKTVSPGSLPGFLRQHYTTSSDMASTLSSYLVSNGASDTRLGGSQAKPSTEPKPEARSSGAGSDQPDRPARRMRPGSQEAAKPDTDGSAQGEPVRQGRKRLARPGEGSDETKPAADGQAPAQMGDDRKLSAKRLSKRGKPGGEEQPKADTTKPDAARIDDSPKTEPKAEPAKDDKPKSETAKETAREESGKPEGAKPAGEGKPEAAKSEPAKIEAPKDNSGAPPVLRADPVPPVTPAPPPSAAPSTAVSSGAPAQPAAPRPSAPAPSSEPPAVTASAPPPAPAGNAGPPAPPISQ
jgi:hypothetical protein